MKDDPIPHNIVFEISPNQPGGGKARTILEAFFNTLRMMIHTSNFLTFPKCYLRYLSQNFRQIGCLHICIATT